MKVLWKQALLLLGSFLLASLPPKARLMGPMLTSAGIQACPVTIPNGRNPPWADAPETLAFPRGPNGHGNGALWTELPPGGKLLPSSEQWNPDGSLDWEWVWDRGVPGRVEVVGRRLDAPAPPATGHYPELQGTLGAQTGHIHFPSEGCWELMARVTGPHGQTSLRVVVLIVRPPFPILQIYASHPQRSILFYWKDYDFSDFPYAIRLILTPAIQERERLWWGREGVWSREGTWMEAPLWSWDYGQLVLETARRSWRGTPKFPNPSGPAQRLIIRGKPGRCLQSSQEDAAALIWEEGAFRYRILQWGLKLSCADLLRIAEGSSTPASGGKR